MFKSLTPITLAMALVAATPLVAQDAQTAAPQTDAEQAAPQDAEAPAGGNSLAFDLGETVPEEPRLGERYSKEQFGDWDLACVKTDTDQDPCSILQIVVDQQGHPVAEVSLHRIEQENSPAVAGATVVVPLETLLPAGLSISVDGAPAKRYNYSFCNPLGCVALIALTQEDVDAYKRGKEAVLALKPAQAPDQVIRMRLSLSGFTAGFNVVDVVKQ